MMLTILEKSEEVRKEVINLLLSKSTVSDSFGPFPALDKTYPAPKGFAGFCPNGSQLHNTRSARSKALRDKDNTSEDIAITLEISSGPEVHPNEEVFINFSIVEGQPVDGIEGALFVIGDKVEFIEGTGPYFISWKVPVYFGKSTF